MNTQPKPKALRPDVISNAASVHEATAWAQHLAHWLSAPWKHEQAPTPAVWLLGFIIELTQRQYGFNEALGIVTRLETKQLWGLGRVNADTPCLLPTPIHYLEPGPYLHYVPINRHRARLLDGLRGCASSTSLLLIPDSHTEGEYGDAATLQLTDRQLVRRRNQLHQCVKRTFDSLYASWRDDFIDRQRAQNLMSCVKPPKRVALSTFINALHQHALLETNQAPALNKILRRSPLPADTALTHSAIDGSLCNPLLPKHTLLKPPTLSVIFEEALPTTEQAADFNRVFDEVRANYNLAQDSATAVERSQAIPANGVKNPNTPVSRSDQDRPAQWVEYTSRYMLRFIQRMRGKMKSQKRLTYGDRKRLLTLVRNEFAQETLILRPMGVPAMALFWVCRKLLSRQCNVSTAKRYLYDVILHGALHHPLSHDLRAWDEEDIEEIRLQITGEDGSRLLASNTQLSRESRLADFVRAGQEMGMIEADLITHVSARYVAMKRRNLLLSFEQIDYKIETLLALESAALNALGVKLILGFYSGMRSEECLDLRVTDISIVPAQNTQACEVYIRIRQGKSGNAPRRIPLHIFAPDEIVNCFVSYCEKRVGQFRNGAALRKINLLGINQAPSSDSIVPYLSDALQALKEEWGESFDWHTLRHNFATWTFTRWLAVHYAEVPALTANTENVLFQEASLNRLARALTAYTHINGPMNSPYHCTALAAVMGHSSFEVTRAHYIHCGALVALLGSTT